MEYLKQPPRPKKLPKAIPPKSKKRLAKEALENQQGKLKVLKPIRKVSAKQADIEREKLKVYRERSQDERPYCRGCGSYTNPLSNSHRIGQEDKKHAANPANLDTLCIGENSCHQKYECGYLFDLDNGAEILEWLAETNWERYAAKVFKMLQRINEQNLSLDDLPNFVEQHVLRVTK